MKRETLYGRQRAEDPHRYDYDSKARIVGGLRARGIEIGKAVLIMPGGAKTWFSGLGQTARDAMRGDILSKKQPVKGILMEITSQDKARVAVDIGGREVIIEIPPNVLNEFQEA